MVHVYLHSIQFNSFYFYCALNMKQFYRNSHIKRYIIYLSLTRKPEAKASRKNSPRLHEEVTLRDDIRGYTSFLSFQHLTKHKKGSTEVAAGRLTHDCY